MNIPLNLRDYETVGGPYTFVLIQTIILFHFLCALYFFLVIVPITYADLISTTLTRINY